MLRFRRHHFCLYGNCVFRHCIISQTVQYFPYCLYICLCPGRYNSNLNSGKEYGFIFKDEEGDHLYDVRNCSILR